MIKPKEKILLISDNLWSFGEGMFGPLLAVFVQRINGSLLNITWAWAIYLIVGGILHIFVGQWSDRLKQPEKLAVWGFALNALLTFSYLLVNTPLKLFVVQAGLGVALAIANPPWYALYAGNESMSERDHNASKWGLWKGAGLVATGMAIVVGGLIVRFLGFTVLFVAMGCVQTLATLYQAKLLRANS